MLRRTGHEQSALVFVLERVVGKESRRDWKQKHSLSLSSQRGEGGMKESCYSVFCENNPFGCGL